MTKELINEMSKVFKQGHNFEALLKRFQQKIPFDKLLSKEVQGSINSIQSLLKALDTRTEGRLTNPPNSIGRVSIDPDLGTDEKDDNPLKAALYDPFRAYGLPGAQIVAAIDCAFRTRCIDESGD